MGMVVGVTKEVSYHMSTVPRLLLFVGILLLAALLVLWRGILPAQAELSITATPSITRTLHPSDWSFVPVVRGEVVGPTVTPTLPPPTVTASPTLTSAPPTITSTPEPSATSSSTPTPTTTATATVITTPEPTITPQPTSTVEPTATATLEPEPTATLEPGDTGDIRIIEIFFDGDVFQVESDEYIEIRNEDAKPINLKGWTLEDEGPNHSYTFPAYTMDPGETCRIYTNEVHPSSCAFNWGHGQAIWNNSGDTATLKDGRGRIIDVCSYDGSGTSETCFP